MSNSWYKSIHKIQFRLKAKDYTEYVNHNPNMFIISKFKMKATFFSIIEECH